MLIIQNIYNALANPDDEDMSKDTDVSHDIYHKVFTQTDHLPKDLSQQEYAPDS